MEREPPQNGPVNVLVVGNDMIVESLPALPVQLAHACLKLGFDLVIPQSWGDELVAEHVLRQLADRAPGPTVLCSCPLVRQRLLSAGGGLLSRLVATVPSSVAVSRQLRAMLGDRLHTLVFAGRCPGARPPDYDLVFDPVELIGQLRSRGIDPRDQPELFENILPPDRRRFASLPGGCPAPEILWQRCNGHRVVELQTDQLAVDLGQLLLGREPILVDVAPALGCSCCGVTPRTTGREARIAVSSLEPPRAEVPVVEALNGVELDYPSSSLAREAGPRAPARFSLEPGAGSSTRTERPPLAITPASVLKIS